MEPQYTGELNFAVELIRKSGELAYQLFHSDGLEVFTKADGSKVTNIDLVVSNYVVEEAQRRGIGVRSEEEGSTATYGDNWVFDLDSIDSTNDLIEGYFERWPRRSNAAPSLGFWDEEPVVGTVIFPLLGVAPITYYACKNGGAYREQDGRNEPLEIDTTPTHGIVFISSKTHRASTKAISSALTKMGYTPVSEHGAVFKASGMADRELLRQYPHNGVYSLGIPVVGCMTQAYLHDFAAVTCIIREAGGITTSPRNQSDKQPWIAANNPAVYDDLVNIMKWATTI